MSDSNHQGFIGPHEGRELELMLKGSKPLSMFVEPLPPEFEGFPEKQFDQLVSQGRLKKHVSIEVTVSPKGPAQIRRVLYALPEEEWRIPALLLVQRLCDSLSPGFRPDLERMVGLLLGYEREDIERFVTCVHQEKIDRVP